MKVLTFDVSFKQLSLLRNLSVANQWSLRLPAGEPVHHVMTFDPNDRNYLFLMTSHHVSMKICISSSIESYQLSYIDFTAQQSMSEKETETGGCLIDRD